MSIRWCLTCDCRWYAPMHMNLAGCVSGRMDDPIPEDLEKTP